MDYHINKLSLLKTLAGLILCLLALGGTARSAQAEKVTLLVTDQTRLQAHFDVVDSAKEELTITFAFFHDDTVGRAFLAKVVAAAKRGVKVRFLLDGLNSRMPFSSSKLPSSTIAYLIHNNVDVRFFHFVSADPRNWKGKMSQVWERMHDKGVVADGVRLVSGTENMGAPYYADLVPADQAPKKRFRGRNILIEGNTAAAAESYFDLLWNSQDVTPPPYSLTLSPEKWLRTEQSLARALAELVMPKHSSDPAEATAPDFTPLQFDVDEKSIFFVSKLGDEFGGPDGLHAKLIEMLKGAKTRIIIETPYLLPEKDVIDILIAKAKLGVEITIYTNSPKSNNHPYGNPLYEGAAQKLASVPGITIKQWAGEETLHGKTVIVDEDQVLISSFNLNLRSLKYDSESGIYMKSQKATAATESDLKIHGFSDLLRPGFLTRCSMRVMEDLLLPTKNSW